MDEEPYEDEPFDDDDWFNPFPMVVFASRNHRIRKMSKSFISVPTFRS